jgi:2Fe-2S ferredoxin
MPKVTFIIVGEPQTVEFEHGKVPYSHHGKPESFLDIAKNFDVPLEHACGGSCACTTCHVIVREGAQHLSEMQDDEADRLDTAWGLTTDSRLGCQAVISGDVVCELPMYTRNYVQEGGGIQLGKSDKRDRKAQEVTDIGIALAEKFPGVDPLTIRFTDLRERVMALDDFDDEPKISNEPKLEAIQMAWYEEFKGE